jgi:hypothetical protein
LRIALAVVIDLPLAFLLLSAARGLVWLLAGRTFPFPAVVTAGWKRNGSGMEAGFGMLSAV